VQRVLSPTGGAESWTVIGPDLRPVEPVDRYLAWLSSIERAPTTVRAYAHDLKTFWGVRRGARPGVGSGVA
jgi:integrase/recombinase XerD